MAATNAGLAFGGMTNCCFRCGLRMFFGVRPVSIVADAFDDIQFHDLVFQQTQCPSRAPFRRLQTGQGAQFRLPGTIEDASPGGGGQVLGASTASDPSSTSCRRARAMVARLVFRAEAIRLKLQASPTGEASAFNRMRAFVSFCARCLPLWIKFSNRSRSSALSFTTYFFTAISLATANRLQRSLRRHRF
jgi:hypothetical protein